MAVRGHEVVLACVSLYSIVSIITVYFVLYNACSIESVGWWNLDPAFWAGQEFGSVLGMCLDTDERLGFVGLR